MTPLPKQQIALIAPGKIEASSVGGSITLPLTESVVPISATYSGVISPQTQTPLGFIWNMETLTLSGWVYVLIEDGEAPASLVFQQTLELYVASQPLITAVFGTPLILHGTTPYTATASFTYNENFNNNVRVPASGIVELRVAAALIIQQPNLEEVTELSFGVGYGNAAAIETPYFNITGPLAPQNFARYTIQRA